MYWYFRRKTKNDLGKDFFKLMNNIVFRKTMENVRRHRDIKLVTTERRRNYFGVRSKFWYYKVFHRISFSKEMKRMQIRMTKPVYLRL